MQSTVLITGASSGIGRACAEILAKHNYNLILLGKDNDALQESVINCRLLDHTITVSGYCLDITSKDEVNNFFESQKLTTDHVNILINCAGVAGGVNDLLDGNFENSETVINTNLTALVHITQKIIPSLLAQKSGHIVNLGSIAGRWVYSKAAVYCATKFAVRAFGEGLRQDLLGTSIRVTTIEPGVVRTNLLGKYLEDKEKAQSFYSTLKPLEASDIAETILWTINRPAHVNIQEIVIYPTDQASATVFNQK